MSTSKSHQVSQPSIMKSTSILSVGTLSSRILGFFRDVILAKVLGTGLRAEAFFVAFKIPNLFREFIGEGATNAALVPVFTEYLENKERQDFWQFVSVILILGLMVLSAITILGIALTPILVRGVAPGFMEDPLKLSLAIRLTKWLFPYLVFIGLTAYSVGILHTFRSFVVPAFSPCLLNIAIIVSALISSQTMKEPVFGLAIGVLIGGILQLGVQIPPLLKLGMRLTKPKTLCHPGAIQTGKLLLPRMVGSGVYQLTVLIDTFCASLAMIVGVGGVAAIYFANRLIQFPLGIFGVSMASAALPDLSKFAFQKDMVSFKQVVRFLLRNVFLMMGPSTLFLFFLAHPIIQVLFQRGAFDAYSTYITASTLRFYALGLISFAGIKILVTAFYALQDTKTPVKVAGLSLGINTVLNFMLMVPLKISGIALASSIAATIHFLILLWKLNKKLKS